VLARLGEGVVTLEARDAAETLALAAAHPDLDLILLDLAMPGMDGFAGLARLRELRPSVPVVVLSASESQADVRATLEGGAMGFVPKSSTAEVMLSALRLVFSGGVYVPPLVLDRAGPPGKAAGASPLGDDLGLTPRQLDVLALLGEGKANKEIAQALGLTEGTVKLHVSAILRALGVENRTQAVIAAERFLRRQRLKR
jgi:DNA-binding NarL/FixJ family response regulator